MPPMPQKQQQQGPSPEQLAAQSMQASHAVALKAADAHSQALDKIHQNIQGQSAPSDREQHLLGLLAGMGTGAPGGQAVGTSGDPQAQQQAVWDTFPSTDPQQAQAIMQHADDPAHGIAALEQQAQADIQKFMQMQQEQLQSIIDALGAPSGGGQPAPIASPGVGGEGAVGY